MIIDIINNSDYDFKIVFNIFNPTVSGRYPC